MENKPTIPTTSNPPTTSSSNERETGMMCTTGVQGVGKTYQNMHIISKYVTDKLDTKVKGRKVLIYDTNGEYTEQEFINNKIYNIKPKLIALKDVEAFGYSNLIEVRRIDAKHLTIDEKQAVLEFVLRLYKNGLFVVEDVNTYILQMHHLKEVIGRLVNLRHRAADVLISYQSLRAVEPRVWANSRWVRMHFQADKVDDIKGKITNPELYKIAQIMVNHRYHNGYERFFVYITHSGQKIMGQFTRKEYEASCRKFLNMNTKIVHEYESTNNCTTAQAYEGLIAQYYKMYYNNPEKESNQKK